MIVSELGLKGPPPPEIDMLALAIGLQLGPGDGLGLMPGDGLGLMPGDGLGLMPGDGLGLMPGDGLGLGPWANVMVAPALRKSTPIITTTPWIQSGCRTRGVCGERLVFAASL